MTTTQDRAREALPVRREHRDAVTAWFRVADEPDDELRRARWDRVTETRGRLLQAIEGLDVTAGPWARLGLVEMKERPLTWREQRRLLESLDLIRDELREIAGVKRQPVKIVVREPHDDSAYIPAKDAIADCDYVRDYPDLQKVLKDNPTIRRRKPSGQRLEVHAGDWNRYKRDREKVLDSPAVETVIDAFEGRKADARRKKVAE